MDKLPTTGPVTTKPYMCNKCGNLTHISTNHWGEVYSRCGNCSWKHPMETDSHTCVEELPKGYALPNKWNRVLLSDIALDEVVEGKER